MTNWLFSAVRIAGTATPLTAWLVQLHSELETEELKKRLEALEDPISQLHPDVPAASAELYTVLRKSEVGRVELNAELYSKYSRPLAALEGAGCIKGLHTLGYRYSEGIRIDDPTFITFYLCPRFEDQERMAQLLSRVDACSRGKSLGSQDLARELGLPNPVVTAMFKVFEAKGYGLLSREIGVNPSYTGIA